MQSSQTAKTAQTSKMMNCHIVQKLPKSQYATTATFPNCQNNKYYKKLLKKNCQNFQTVKLHTIDKSAQNVK